MTANPVKARPCVFDLKQLLERGKDDAEARLSSQGALGLLVLGALLGPLGELLAETLACCRDALDDLDMVASGVVSTHRG